MFDINGISSHLGLFYAKRLGNRIRCTFIFIFFEEMFIKKVFVCTESNQIRIFLDVSFKDENLTSTTTLGQTASGSNGASPSDAV